MSDNVGLSTPRGSGTSGYVQRNLAHIRPRDSAAPYPKDLDSLRHRQRQPDKGILEHDRKREIEVKVFELRDELEDQGYVCPITKSFLPSGWLGADLCFLVRRVDEDDIEDRCEALRKKLLDEQERDSRRGAPPKKGLKMHQVHELADAKIKESERLRRALKISKDYEEGSHWKRQEERLQGSLDDKEPSRGEKD